MKYAEIMNTSMLESFERLLEKKDAKLRKSCQSGLPNAKTWAGLDNNNNSYLAYRFGIAMAASPYGDDMPKHGPIAQNFVTIGYTDADDDITERAGKMMGVSGKNVTTKKSKELNTINISSPVRKYTDTKRPKR